MRLPGARFSSHRRNIMIRYKATAPAQGMRDPKTGEPVEAFKGKTCGIQFQDNVAIFDDITAKNIKMDRTALEIARSLKNDFGYTVTQIDENGAESPFNPAPPKAVLVTASFDAGDKSAMNKPAAKKPAPRKKAQVPHGEQATQ
jgi:hypothetical protein